MGWGNYGGMMSGLGFFGFFMTAFYLILLIDLILLGVWLWKQIQKK